MIGRTLGHYRLTAEIGSGGMGVVYRARDERLDRDVAIKVLLPGALEDDESRKRFRREALALSKLNHPNIATIHDFDSQDGVDFVVMEFLEGATLVDRPSRQMPEADVVRLGRQIAAALEEAHEHGIVHRDLKPGNIVLTPKGQAKLLDFGLAVAVSVPETDLTVSVLAATSGGTVPYMAPEQLLGLPVDARCDVWAAGAVMYELATGTRPFPERQGPALVGAILHKPVQPPRELNPAVTPALERVLLKCLEKEPSARFQSARDLHRAIDDIERASTVATAIRTEPFVKGRGRSAWLAAALTAAVAVAGAFAWIAWPRRAGPDAPVLVLVGEFQNRTGETVFDQTLQDLLTTALQNSRVVSVFPPSRTRAALARMQKPADTVVDEAVGREICQREGLQALVSGSIARLGTSYVLIVRAIGPNGASLASEQRTAAEAGRVPAELDAIARRIRTGLGESLSSVQEHSAPLEQVTSGSLDAVRYFTLGRQRLAAGDPVEAVSWFDKAIALDSSFAMAHGYLGIAYQNLNDLDRAEASLRTGSELANRVTDTERLKIQGDYHVLIGDFDAGCDDFQALARLQPQDPAPFHGLGLCHARKMEYDQALVETQKALALSPSFNTRYNIARLYLHKGDLARARTEADAVLRGPRAHADAQRLVGRVLELEGDVAGAEHAFETMIAIGGSGAVAGQAALADLFLATGRYRRARSHLDAVLVSAEKQGDALAGANGKMALAEYLAETGSVPAAVQLAAALGAVTDPPFILNLGKFYARHGRPADLQRMLQAMEQIAAKKPNPHVRSLYHQLVAEAELRGNPAAAVEAAERAVAFERSVFAVEQLARSYDAAGRRDDAIVHYREVLKRAAERADGDDDPAFRRVVEAQYRVGALLQDAGKADEARTHLSAALAYWSNADATLTLKKDAEDRLRRVSQSAPAAGTPKPAT